MFYKKIFLFLLFVSFSSNLFANQKDQIINQLENLSSLEFTFNQFINERLEKGSCLLEFPGKLKWEYFDDKQKELIINDRKMTIIQKKYNKTYQYPISKSPFINILYKEKLLEIIKSGKMELSEKSIKLIYLNENKIIINFHRENLDLKGWEIVDQYNNNINFSLNIVSKNDIYKEDTFKVPSIN